MKTWMISLDGKLLLIILFLILGYITVSAQKEVTVTKEYIYRAPGTMSLIEAQRVALEQAKLEAIEEAFGTTISQSNLSYISTHDGETNMEFQSLRSSEIKGEWIETLEGPTYDDIYSEDGFLIVPCKIKGKIREFVAPEVDFMAKILCNGVTPQHEREDFMEGDDLFLSFQSPYKGYLMAFLTDFKIQTTYCILPYFLSSDDQVKIDKNKEYVFFSKEKADKDTKSLVDEYVMTCQHSNEINEVTVVFSAKPFTLPIYRIDEDGFKYLSYGDFNKWIEKIRKKRKDIAKKSYIIRINKL